MKRRPGGNMKGNQQEKPNAALDQLIISSDVNALDQPIINKYVYFSSAFQDGIISVFNSSNTCL
jgi:hypothetical protein